MSGTIKVMGFGTFDGLHEGHLNFFQQLKSLGDELIIIIARDSSVERIKSRTPRLNEKERLKLLKKINLIDDAVLGNEKDFYQVIRDYQPSIIGLGYDQRANIDELIQTFPEIQMIRLKPFQPEQYKSSLLSEEEILNQKKGIPPAWMF